MASEGSTLALLKRREDDQALMPPPPVKRIKRPTEVLDEDDYTDALSNIIARDYYPGLREAEAQEEYLSALDSENPAWIKEAGRKLREATSGTPEEVKKARWTSRDTRFDTPRSYRQAVNTPRGPSTGAETPVPVTDTNHEDEDEEQDTKPEVNTSKFSLTAYQSKFTSEDNSSFNTLLDAQNTKRRSKHAYLFTPDQQIPSRALTKQRTQLQALLKAKEGYESTNGTELIPLEIGAIETRAAKPSSWKVTKPDNSFMFISPTSVDELGLQTIQEQKEAMSLAGPKTIVRENTRFPPHGPSYSAADEEDDTTSIHTSFIDRRNAAGTDAGTLTGAETPRVNGYSFVDDEEPRPPAQRSEPSYRDILAGQTGDSTPNPFKLKEIRSREDLHRRLVEKDAERKRAKVKEITPVGRKDMGTMTPAGRKLMERLGGRTPVVGKGVEREEERREVWTPVATPRRQRGAMG